ELRTSGGDITVSLPRTYAATLDASTVAGDVDCDLPFTPQGSTETRRSRNSLRGSINGGGALLYAHTAGGDIQIRAK
ncbi:MAG: DUF4097 family beta strand repeat protein, partial [Candidatus Obscuribacterales bacterium]|nr:DUF4097 family beta strand repeat protein [Steroidobacteraceae bacterium]